MTIAEELKRVAAMGGWRKPREALDTSATAYNRANRDEVLRKRRAKKMALRKAAA